MSTPLEDALRDCVREICDRIAKHPEGPFFELTSEESEWKRNADGYFRRQSRERFTLRQSREFLNFESFRRCADLAKSDPIIGPQIGQMVGTTLQRTHLSMEPIVQSLRDAMVLEDGQFEFREDLFQEHWGLLFRDLAAAAFPYVTIALLPKLTAPFPVKLSENISIDRLTDEEVNDCAQVGMLPLWPRDVSIFVSEQAIGIRSIWSLEKIVGEPGQTLEAGGFGCRSPLDSATNADDIITGLRLFKSGTIHCPGQISVLQRRALFTGSMTIRMQRIRPWDWCQYDLNESDVAGLQSLWHTLTGGVLEKRNFVSECLRRFDMAADRERLEDRIVDLMIAAESLFLHDAGPARERGEMRYRLAVRAAGYVESTHYDRRQVYDLLREAYDVRSAVVHGGSIRHTKLPDKPGANLGEFTLAVEEVLRLGIKKALVDPDIEKPGFWDNLLFPGAIPPPDRKNP